MPDEIKLEEKYERNGWPSITRPDIQAPAGWSLGLISSVNRIHNHKLAPSGEYLAFVWDRDSRSDIYTLPVNGGWPRRHSTERAAALFWDDENPQPSPDGEWLAFSMRDHVYIAPQAGSLPKRISDFAPAASSPVWLQDSQRLLVTVERNEALHLLLTDREGAWPRPLFTGPGDAMDAQPAPDGKKIAFVRHAYEDLNRLDIWMVETESGQAHPITGQAKTKDWWPRWSPDGKQIAFLSQRTEFTEAWLVDADGGNLRQLTRLGMDVADLDWSPDGTQIACVVNRGGSFELALIDASSGEVRTLRADQGVHMAPQWSPHGDFLIVSFEDATQPPDLYRVEVPGGKSTQLTYSNLPALAANKLIIPEVVSYKSFDGLEIPAFLYRPVKPNGAALINPHGGPSGQHIHDWDQLRQYLVAKGYTLLAPNYRGSTGYGVTFEHSNYNDWGGGDTQDCLFGARYLGALEEIDREKLGIYGGSYGGYMVACCLTRDPDYLFACGVSKYGDAHLESSWALCNRRLRWYTEMMIGNPGRNQAVYLKGSPIFQVEKIRKPILLLHGLADDIVPPEASEAWAEAMRHAGKTFEYKTYTSEPHGFLNLENQLDVYTRIERFLDWYLMPKPAE
jgi:dipeptidyl aminopeptidase/acylaminoacyl peptidase